MAVFSQRFIKPQNRVNPTVGYRFQPTVWHNEAKHYEKDKTKKHRTSNEEEPQSASLPGQLRGRCTMKKQRADAKWNELTEAQRETLEQWLFEERLAYQVAWERAQQELGFTGSVSSIRRFHEHMSRERTLRSLGVVEASAEEIDQATVNTAALRAAGMKLVAQLFLKGVMESPEELKHWAPLARLLLQSESNEIKYRLKQEENELRRQELEFAREKFQYDMMAQAQKALPELQALAEANLTQYEKNKRRNDLRRRMFGPNIPEILPENEAEEEAMAKQKVIDDAERAKQHEWWLKTFRSGNVAEAAEEAPGETDAGCEMQDTGGGECEEAKAPGEVVERGVVYPYGQ
jgi:hypothetical protein